MLLYILPFQAKYFRNIINVQIDSVLCATEISAISGTRQATLRSRDISPSRGTFVALQVQCVAAIAVLAALDADILVLPAAL